MRDTQISEESLLANEIESGMMIMAPFGEDKAMKPLPILFVDKTDSTVVSLVLGSGKDAKIFSENIRRIPIKKEEDVIIIYPEYAAFLPFKDCLAIRDKNYILYEFFDKSA